MVRGRVRDRYLELQASRDVERFERAACALIGAEVKLSGGNHIAYAGTAQAQAQARSDLLLHSALAGIGIFLLLYIAFNNLLVLPAILLHFGRFAPADDVMRG